MINPGLCLWLGAVLNGKACELEYKIGLVWQPAHVQGPSYGTFIRLGFVVCPRCFSF